MIFFAASMGRLELLQRFHLRLGLHGDFRQLGRLFLLGLGPSSFAAASCSVGTGRFAPADTVAPLASTLASISCPVFLNCATAAARNCRDPSSTETAPRLGMARLTDVQRGPAPPCAIGGNGESPASTPAMARLRSDSSAGSHSGASDETSFLLPAARYREAEVTGVAFVQIESP